MGVCVPLTESRRCWHTPSPPLVYVRALAYGMRIQPHHRRRLRHPERMRWVCQGHGLCVRVHGLECRQSCHGAGKHTTCEGGCPVGARGLQHRHDANTRMMPTHMYAANTHMHDANTWMRPTHACCQHTHDANTHMMPTHAANTRMRPTHT